MSLIMYLLDLQMIEYGNELRKFRTLPLTIESIKFALAKSNQYANLKEENIGEITLEYLKK